MIITIPNNNIKERVYVIDSIFHSFLGLKYKIEYGKISYYSILLNNGNELKIKDAFFSKFKNEKEYLDVDNIPKTISHLESNLFNNTIVLFGDNTISVNDKNITLGSDVFASTFFMLTRWEEYVTKKRDHFNRFSVEYSLAYKFDFTNRAIVNEYVELIWKMLVHLGYERERKIRNFEMILTHDVDVPKMWWNIKEFVYSFLVSIKNKKMREAYSFLKFKLQNKDPYDTFDYLMTISERFNLQSHFFFMSEAPQIKIISIK